LKGGRSSRCGSGPALAARESCCSWDATNAREWIAVEVPFLLAKELIESQRSTHFEMAQRGRDLGRADGQSGRA
jgi:hypothetical protein